MIFGNKHEHKWEEVGRRRIQPFAGEELKLGPFAAELADKRIEHERLLLLGGTSVMLRCRCGELQEKVFSGDWTRAEEQEVNDGLGTEILE